MKMQVGRNMSYCVDLFAAFFNAIYQSDTDIRIPNYSYLIGHFLNLNSLNLEVQGIFEDI